MSSSSGTDNLPAFDQSRRLQYTEPPHPSWTYGQKTDATPDGKEWAEGEKTGFKTIQAEHEDPVSLYRLMVSGIIPRPVAFVSSLSEDNVENLAPFSWFNMVSGYPPLVSISVSNVSESLKDTSTNIRATKGFTVNIISEPFIEGANITCVDAPKSVSEWSISGLTKAPSTYVKPARVQESAFSMECELFKDIDIIHPVTQEKTTTLILGLVKAIHVRNDVLNEKGLVDPARLRPIARGGDITYFRSGDAYRLPRPSWKLEGENISQFLQALEGKNGGD